MTGKYPARLGITAHIGDPQPENWTRDTPLRPARYVTNLSLKETTLAEKLHAAGYTTLHAGKWHLGDERHWPEYQGFDVNVGGWSNGGPFGGKQYFSPYGNPRLPNGPEGEHLADRLADETARFINSRRYKPFFVYLPFYSVHVPLVAKQELAEKYSEKRSHLPRAGEKLIPNADGMIRARQDHAVYAAMVEAMDTAVARVLRALDEARVRGNTVVIFTSDNGGLATGDCAIPSEEGWPTTNAPLRAGKGWLYEGGVRVPLIVSVPRVAKAGDVSSRIVTGTDIYRTVLELISLDAAPGEAPDSESFAASLSGEESQRGPTYWHYPHYGNQGGRPGGALRDGDWKLVEWYGKDPTDSDVELYNLADDIGESRDLSSEQARRCADMLKRLRSWREKLNAKMPTASSPVQQARSINEPSPKSAALPN